MLTALASPYSVDTGRFNKHYTTSLCNTGELLSPGRSEQVFKTSLYTSLYLQRTARLSADLEKLTVAKQVDEFPIFYKTLTLHVLNIPQ
jgi:hypothetical protein